MEYYSIVTMGIARVVRLKKMHKEFSCFSFKSACIRAPCVFNINPQKYKTRL